MAIWIEGELGKPKEKVFSLIDGLVNVFRPRPNKTLFVLHAPIGGELGL
jgi:hypothetical protein